MKICMISPLGYTGIGYYDYSLCESLARNNVDITLFSSENWVVRKKYSFRREVVFKGTMGETSRLLKGVNYFISWCKSILKIVKENFNIIHCQIMELPIVDILFLLLLKLMRKKIVFTPHDIHSLKSKKNNVFSNLIYRLSNHIIVHNLANRDLLVNEFKTNDERIKIIPHGNYNYFLNPGIQKNEARDKIDIPKDKKAILLFGNIRPGKGIETAVAAFKLLRDKKNVLLLIAGKVSRGYDLEAIKTEMKEEFLGNSIILRDYFIEDNLVESYYKASDVVIVPYEYGYESGVLRYAFSCGVPTIISNLKEFSGFARNGENCLIFNAKDASDLAEKINTIFESPDIAQRISSAAKKLSDNEWDWQQAAFETKKLYEQLL